MPMRCSEVFYGAPGYASRERSMNIWTDSVRTAPGSPVSLESLDYALCARGYVRTSYWRSHATAADVLRYFAKARVEIGEDLP